MTDPSDRNAKWSELLNEYLAATDAVLAAPEAPERSRALERYESAKKAVLDFLHGDE